MDLDMFRKTLVEPMPWGCERLASTDVMYPFCSAPVGL